MGGWTCRRAIAGPMARGMVGPAQASVDSHGGWPCQTVWQGPQDDGRPATLVIAQPPASESWTWGLVRAGAPTSTGIVHPCLRPPAVRRLLAMPSGLGQGPRRRAERGQQQWLRGVCRGHQHVHGG